MDTDEENPSGAKRGETWATINSLPPENELGNVEYKSQLIGPSSSRLQHLSTQMKWRLSEGDGEAIYEIGVSDDGSILGLNQEQMNASLDTIQNMASCINASVTIMERRVLYDGSNIPKYSLQLLIRKLPEKSIRVDLRVAIIGAAGSGKSTLCGVLTQGKLDNGNGQTRISIFRHLHEFRTGSTSSICSDVVGFSPNGEVLNYKEHTLEELLERSSKLITLIDLAGDKKFLKTTIYGVSGYAAHYCTLLINARTGLNTITKEHFGLAVAIGIPLFIVITKIDLVHKSQMDRVLKSVKQLIDSAQTEFVLKRVETKGDAESSASLLSSRRVVPVIPISNVTGQNIEILSHFLAFLPQAELPLLRNVSNSGTLDNEKKLLFYIEEVFQLERIGVVACGLLAEGTLAEGDQVKCGPNSDGKYFLATVKSIHQNKQSVVQIGVGDTASIALTSIFHSKLAQLRRGKVLIDTNGEELACRRFVARFYLQQHTLEEICIGFQGTVYIGSLRRTVTIVDCEAPAIAQGEWQLVTFKFHQQPEFLRVGMPLIFRECRTKAMGTTVEVFAE